MHTPQVIEINKQRQVLKEAVNAKVKLRNRYHQVDEPANKIQRMLVLKQGEGPVLGTCFNTLITIVIIL